MNFPHQNCGMPHTIPGAVEMNLDHRIEFFGAHVEYHPFSQDTGTVNEDIQLSEIFHTTVDNSAGGIVIIHRLKAGDGGPARFTDLFDRFVYRRFIRSFAAGVRFKGAIFWSWGYSPVLWRLFFIKIGS